MYYFNLNFSLWSNSANILCISRFIFFDFFLFRRPIQLATFLCKRNVWKTNWRWTQTFFKVYEYLCKLFSCKTTSEKKERSLYAFSTHFSVCGTCWKQWLICYLQWFKLCKLRQDNAGNSKVMQSQTQCEYQYQTVLSEEQVKHLSVLFVLLKMDSLSRQIRLALRIILSWTNMYDQYVWLICVTHHHMDWYWGTKIHWTKPIYWFCSVFPQRYSLWYRWQDSQQWDWFCLWL